MILLEKSFRLKHSFHEFLIYFICKFSTQKSFLCILIFKFKKVYIIVLIVSVKEARGKFIFPIEMFLGSIKNT